MQIRKQIIQLFYQLVPLAFISYRQKYFLNHFSVVFIVVYTSIVTPFDIGQGFFSRSLDLLRISLPTTQNIRDSKAHRC